jgi:type IV pilus assembly protein PilQ
LADQPPRQVLIEAHIMQIDLACDCRSGVNFDALATSASGNELNFRTVGFANPAATTAFFMEATGGAIESLVELLQTTTDAKTLASPKVLVVSGQQARMQVGEQLGFRVVTTTQTSTLEEVQFLDVGVVLTVTPRVTRDGRVLMRIKPEVSTGLVSPETGLPSEETTEVETDVMLSDGHGMVIGGLIQERDLNIQSKIPWLGDLPYVGILFQKRRVEKIRSEIIVTLVPHIQPYTPIVADRENHQLMKTLEPLTVGPLDRFHRPYEAQLPDTFTNPRRPLMTLLQPLPPVEETSNSHPSAQRPKSIRR